MTRNYLIKLLQMGGHEVHTVTQDQITDDFKVVTGWPVTNDLMEFIKNQCQSYINIEYIVRLPGKIHNVDMQIVFTQEEVKTGNPYIDNALENYQNFCESDDD